jgi:hypothetical protein
VVVLVVVGVVVLVVVLVVVGVVVAVVVLVVVVGVVVTLGDAAACAGTMTDCTTGRVQDFGKMARAAPVPIAFRSSRRPNSLSIEKHPTAKNCYTATKTQGQMGLGNNTILGPSIADMSVANTPDAYALMRRMLSALGPGERGIEDRAELIALELEVKDASLWEQLAGESDYHGVTLLIEPIVAAASRTAARAVPDSARRAFFALASHHRQAAIARESCVDRLLTTFTTAGVRMILLKGAALAHRIYPKLELRPMADIDILIDPADTQAAIKLAEGLGYVFAPRHASKYARRMHHLPPAMSIQSGFRIFLEIHSDTMSPYQPHSLTLSTLAAKLQPFRRGSGPDGLTLGHTDMLRHLARHAFEPARQIRLIHLYDLWRYQTIFHDEIDWRELDVRYPYVIVVLRLVSDVFPNAQSAAAACGTEFAPAGVGFGMMPLAEIAAANMSTAAKMSAMIHPPAWWLHGFYGVPLDRSLLLCRTVRHPAMVARWLLRRGAAASGLLGIEAQV